MATRVRKPVTVQPDEVQLIKFGPHGIAGISGIMELPDGTQLVYIGPV